LRGPKPTVILTNKIGTAPLPPSYKFLARYKITSTKTHQPSNKTSISVLGHVALPSLRAAAKKQPHMTHIGYLYGRARISQNYKVEAESVVGTPESGPTLQPGGRPAGVSLKA
jgi:hypothetical protein